MLDPTGHYRVGAVTCWIQQSVSPKQVVGFSCLFNSEVDQLISKVIVCESSRNEAEGVAAHAATRQLEVFKGDLLENENQDFQILNILQ